METLHGHEPCNSDAADDEAAILNAFFKRGMLTTHADRLIDLALQELGLGLRGHWTADRVKVMANLVLGIRRFTADDMAITGLDRAQEAQDKPTEPI
jgi:hypothetical protein